MPIITSIAEVKRLAGLELNDLAVTKNLPREVFDRSRISSAGTPVCDVNGELLFNRVPIRKGPQAIGYVDLAVNPALGATFLAASYGTPWTDRALRAQAVQAAQRLRRGLRFDRMRFVAYSYPKLAVQFLRGSAEVLMLELHSWTPVPQARRREPEEPPGHFERWSLLDEIPTRQKRANSRRFQRRLAQWDELCPPERPPRRIRPEYVRVREFERLVRDFERLPLVTQREIHYSPEDVDHHPCYELRSQLTGVWCVAASVQMTLDFYRYNYAQTRIAADLGLGTLNNPNGLPYAQDGRVVTVLEALSGNAVDSNMNTSPTWNEFVAEVNADRPLISFIPGHSRTVAGYTRGPSVLGGWFSGLLVYDPWPPSPSVPPTPTTGGVITRWENFDAQTYRRTFTAELLLH